jgi:hypothetical protein
MVGVNNIAHNQRASSAGGTAVFGLNTPIGYTHLLIGGKNA